MPDTTPFLESNRLYLRPVEPEDLPAIRRWVNDPEVRGMIGEVRPASRHDSEEWLKRVQEDRDRVWFVVVLKETGRVIGEAGLLRIFPAWRQADMTVIIGDKEYWGQGYGSEAGRLVLDYAFGNLNMHRLSIGVVGWHERALHFWEKLGFRREGVQRDGYYYNHRYSDFIMMGILEHEYREQYGIQR